MKFDKVINEMLGKKVDEKLGCHDAADKIVSIFNETQPDEIAGAVIEAMNRFYTLDQEQSLALATFFDEHLSD
jgi:hypothetical protein